MAQVGGKQPNKNSKPMSIAPTQKPSTTTGKGKKPGGNYGAQGGYAGVPYGQAAKVVNKQIADAVKDLRKNKKTVRRQTNKAQAQNNALYQNSLTDINKVSSETGGFIAGQQDKIAASNAATTQAASAAQSALAAQLGSNATSGAQAIAGTTAQFGIMGGADTDAFNRMQAGSVQQAEQNSVNNGAIAAAMGSNSTQIGALLAGMSAGSRQQSMAGALANRNAAHSELEQARQDAFQQSNQAIKETRSKRGDLTRQLLKQLAATGWARYLQQHPPARSGGGYTSGGSTTGGGSVSALGLSTTTGTSKTPTTTGGYTGQNDALMGILKGNLKK